MNNSYPLKKDAYLAFDSLSLKQFLKDRLTEQGVLTDQAYEGSYLSTLIDIVAYTFNTLIFYLNRTSTETLFTDAQLYENLNRIVKSIGYNPIGKQSPVLTFSASALNTMDVGVFTLPRYSYITLGAASYSFNEDITFFKSLSAQDEYFKDFSEKELLYQGRFIEYPVYNAIGTENELVFLLPGDNVIIDHFNIQVYVKPAATGVWEQWDRTNSLYVEGATDKKFEVRLNENLHYEIKFGNNINGKKLEANDQVAIYYLKSNGKDGEVGPNALRAGKVVKYATTQFNQIFSDITIDQVTLLPDNQVASLTFDNSSSSTYYASEESTDSIRQNAPSNYRAQYRLVTKSDHENYIRTNFTNLIHDVKAISNWQYLSEYLKYFYDIGIANPNKVSRVLYNQVNFADSCNFNNVYLFAVSKILTSSQNPISYLNPAIKELIINTMNDIKILTSELIILDPVFMAVGLAIAKTGIDVTPDDIANTELYIVKKNNSRRDSNAIQEDITNIFVNYFDRQNIVLGQFIDITELTNRILSVDGVETFFTRRTDDPNVSYEGLSMILWNPIYTTDVKPITKNESLAYFKFPYLYNSDTFNNYINVEAKFKTFETVEY